MHPCVQFLAQDTIARIVAEAYELLSDPGVRVYSAFEQKQKWSVSSSEWAAITRRRLGHLWPILLPVPTRV